MGREEPPRAPQLGETPETPPSSRAEGLLFLHGLVSGWWARFGSQAIACWPLLQIHSYPLELGWEGGLVLLTGEGTTPQGGEAVAPASVCATFLWPLVV